MATAGKDTIYVDVDDEITNVIDKVKTSPHKIVALVLPKRCAVLQSVVNMKLLKKTALAHKKNIVLITSEPGLLPLAGVAGLHVAKSLQSKPEIPALPSSPLDDESVIAIDETPLSKKEAGVHAAAKAEVDADEDETETIDLDNTVPADTGSMPVKPGKIAKNKRLKVPNFDKFRTGLMLGIVGLILLIVGGIFANVVLPKATITITTDTTTVTSQFELAASTDIKTLDATARKVPATYKEIKKTDSQKVQATGTKDNGTKATGTMTVFNCSDDTVTLGAGAIFTNSGISFATDEVVDVPSSDFFSNGTCKKNRSITVAVTAVKAGTTSNIEGNRDYVSNIATSITGRGSSMVGGTSNIVKIVSQTDLDNAAVTMKGRLDSSALTTLKTQLQKEDLYPLTASEAIGEAKIASIPAVGEETTGDVTVTAETVYGMLGVKQSDLSILVKKDASKQIDTNKQAITNDGLKNATIQLAPGTLGGKNVTLTLSSQVTAGPEIDSEAIKELAKGKKRGVIESEVGDLPGVTGVTVTYKPFWVLSTPKSAKKIEVVVKKAGTTQTVTGANGGL